MTGFFGMKVDIVDKTENLSLYSASNNPQPKHKHKN